MTELSNRGRRARSWRSAGVLTVGLALFAAMALGACGGDDSSSGSGSSSVTLDPARGDAIAHAAMVQVGDLPGSGWTVTSTDKFDDSNTPFSGDSDTCKQISAKLDASQKASTAARAGRAQTEFEKTAAANAALPTSIQVSLNIFKDADTPATSFKSFRDVIGSDDFRKCLSDSFKAGLGPNDKAEVKSVSAGASAPKDGSVGAYDLDVSSQGFTGTFRMEFYVWQYNNSGNTVFFFGSKDDLKGDLQKAVLDKTQQKLESAK